MKVYGCQWDIVWEDKAANFRRVTALLEAADPEPGSLIVLPEMFGTGFSMDLRVTREALTSETGDFLDRLAMRFGCCVLAGMVRSGRGVSAQNLAVALDPRGRILARMAKLHPFSPVEEGRFMEPGQEVVVFDWAGFTVAPFVCYDLRFPEVFRRAMRRGATLFGVLANWPAAREDHWVTLLRARAIENQACVVGINRCGSDPRGAYPGRSLIIGPRGELLADAGPGEGVVIADLDPAQVAAWRAEFPALRDARFL